MTYLVYDISTHPHKIMTSRIMPGVPNLMTTQMPIPTAAMVVLAVKAEDETCPSSPSTTQTNNNNKNYWGWKETVKGTLSSLNLSNLGKNKELVVSPETLDSTTSSDALPKVTTGGGGYWEWTETIQKTLSNVSLGTMGHHHREDVAAVDAKNTVAVATDGDEAAPVQSHKNYWHWRNSFKSASDLAQQQETKKGDGAAPEAPGSYWFWRNPSMTSLSQANLEQTAGQQVQGGSVVEASTPTKTGGPISNLEHKLRNSWRKSFQQMSSNSLTKLDEGQDESKASSWKDSFRSFRKSVQNLNAKPQNDVVVQDVVFTSENEMLDESNQSSLKGHDSQQSLGGISF